MKQKISYLDYLEKFVVYFPVLFFLLFFFLKDKSVYSSNPSYTESLSILSYILIILIPALIVFLKIRRKEMGAHLRAIGMILFLWTLSSQYYKYPALGEDVVMGLSILFILLILIGSIIDVISVHIKGKELSKIRKGFSIFCLIIILSFIVLSLLKQLSVAF